MKLLEDAGFPFQWYHSMFGENNKPIDIGKKAEVVDWDTLLASLCDENG